MSSMISIHHQEILFQGEIIPEKAFLNNKKSTDYSSWLFKI